MRHHKAYAKFVSQILEVDASEMILAFYSMMKKKITMPAVFIREAGEDIGSAFEQFSNAAQRIGVYTSMDYIEILEKLLAMWHIDKISGLTSQAEKARDYLMDLPVRMRKVAHRLIIPKDEYVFQWVRKDQFNHKFVN